MIGMYHGVNLLRGMDLQDSLRMHYFKYHHSSIWTNSLGSASDQIWIARFILYPRHLKYHHIWWYSIKTIWMYVIVDSYANNTATIIKVTNRVVKSSSKFLWAESIPDLPTKNQKSRIL